jgi:hypothetical protein
MLTIFNLSITEIGFVIAGIGFVIILTTFYSIRRKAKREYLSTAVSNSIPEASKSFVDDDSKIIAKQTQQLLNQNGKMLAEEMAKFGKNIANINMEIQKSTVEELKQFTPRYSETLEILVATLKKITDELDKVKSDYKELQENLMTKLEKIEHKNLLTDVAIIYLLNGLQGAKGKELYDKINKKTGVPVDEIKDLIKEINLSYVL